MVGIPFEAANVGFVGLGDVAVKEGLGESILSVSSGLAGGIHVGGVGMVARTVGELAKTVGEVGGLERAFDSEFLLFDRVVTFASQGIGPGEKGDDERERGEQSDASEDGDTGFAFGPLGEMNHGADRVGRDGSTFQPSIKIRGKCTD